jgi:hypothetical protein
MNTTYKPLSWSTREEWAYRIQHPYWDYETGCPFADKYGHCLSDYATPHEVAVLTAELKSLYRELGRKLREAKLRAGLLLQQPGESNASWYERFRALSKADKERASAPLELQRDRRQINDLLKRIADDAIPHSTKFGTVWGKAGELVAPFAQRYDAAFKAAHEQWEQECLQIPVDDAAWEKELQRREEIEHIRKQNRLALA